MSHATTKGSGLAWFVRRGVVVRGPFSSAKIRHFVLDGRLGPEDEVSPDRQDWRRLGSVAEVLPPQLRGDAPDLAVATDVQRREEQVGALRTIAVTGLILVAITVMVSLIGRPSIGEERDCAADPAPGVSLEGCDLSGAQLRGAALAGVQLNNASLAGAVLAEAELGGADLRYSDLRRSDLSYADLSGASLKGANLRHADLTNSNLADADLSFADLSGARIGGAQLNRANLDGAVWFDGRPCARFDCPR